ncbi:hypothetical protein [Pseudomaricurvus sp. HS19]|uniref:hypothetical protein n=1 Tax=Pseudomaricurvus sp. HS19 TaxID=2692626 RepID=UPI00136F5A0D|nr:hypothetical protein [Pseudomaricurvus sp. HS19]MYM62766.1 hypothetical protein [Pseudomaricurvus sp. HS19]
MSSHTFPLTETSTTDQAGSYTASGCWEQAYAEHGVDPEDLHITPLRQQQASPLGLSFYAPPQLQRQLQSSPYSPRHLLDAMLRELGQRSEDTGRRKVLCLYWHLPHDLLDDAEVTEFMYFVGRRYPLGDNPEVDYCVGFSGNDLQPGRLALFKGLGFNHLQLVWDGQQSGPQTDLPTVNGEALLTRASAYCQQFHFRHFSLRLEHPLPHLERTLRAMETAGMRLPERIVVTPDSSAGFERFSEQFRALRQLQYRVLGNDCFVRSASPLANAQAEHHLTLNTEGYNHLGVHDVVGLGPGNRSSLGHLRQLNPATLTDYLRLQPRLLFAPLPNARLKAFIDSLLCYHSADLKYLQDRYQLNLETILQRWREQEQTPGELFSINNSQIHLTECGILRLATLCKQALNPGTDS